MGLSDHFTGQHDASVPATYFNAHYEGDGATIYKHACALGCEGIVSKRLGSPYRSGRSAHWLKIKNPTARPAPEHDRPYRSRRSL
jgi:ATP-dependent DNA ligase